MIPIISLVGRNGVGKSSLFNKLIHKTRSLKTNFPGSTRDRKYGYVKWRKKEFVIIDTGGIKKWKNNKKIDSLILYHTLIAIKESNIILLVLDYTNQSIEFEKKIFKFLKNFENKIVLVILNKVDQINVFKNFENLARKYYCLSEKKNIIPISTVFGYGIKNLIERIFSFEDHMYSYSHCYLSSNQKKDTTSYNLLEKSNKKYLIFKKNEVKLSKPKIDKKIQETFFIKVSVIGYPNVGKSTFINSILREERIITFNTPGTTQENIFIPFEYEKKKYVFVDTPGIKRSFQKNKNKFEKFFIENTIQAIQYSDIILLILDASRGILEQELFLLKKIQEEGKPFIFIVNKWDKLSNKNKKHFIYILKIKLCFVFPATIYYVSSLLKKINTKKIFNSIRKIFKIFKKEIQTSTLTKILKKAINKKKIPYSHRKIIKLNLAHIGGHFPITIIVHGTNTQYIPNSYKRYLEKFFRLSLNYSGILIAIKFHKKTIKNLKKHP